MNFMESNMQCRLHATECQQHSTTNDDKPTTYAVQARNIVIATGGQPSRIPIPGAEHAIISDKVRPSLETSSLPDQGKHWQARLSQSMQGGPGVRALHRSVVVLSTAQQESVPGMVWGTCQPSHVTCHLSNM